MYDSHNIAILIKERAKEKGVVIKTMLEELELGSNTMSSMYHGKAIAADRLARIADYLGCSVDYLLGREDTAVPVQQNTERGALMQRDDPLLCDLLKSYDELNTEGREAVAAAAKGLAANPEYKKCASPELGETPRQGLVG